MSYENLISFLEEAAPVGLKALRDRFPDASDMLANTKTLGERSATAQTSNKEQEALVDLLKVSLDSLTGDLDGLAVSIRQRMTVVSRIRFSGAIVAAVSGGITAVLQYLSTTPQTITVLGALVSMVGGLATLFADQFEKAPNGVRIASLEEYGKMTEMRGDVERIRTAVSRNDIVPMPADELKRMLERVDGCAAQVIRLKFSAA